MMEVTENEIPFYNTAKGDRIQKVVLEADHLLFKDSKLISCFVVSYKLWWQIYFHLKQFQMTYNSKTVLPPLGVPQRLIDGVQVCTLHCEGYYYLDIRRYKKESDYPTKEGIRLNSSAVHSLVALTEKINENIYKKGNMAMIKQSLSNGDLGGVYSLTEWCNQKMRSEDFRSDTDPVDRIFDKVYSRVDESAVKDIFLIKMGYNFTSVHFLDCIAKYPTLIRRLVNCEEIGETNYIY